MRDDNTIRHLSTLFPNPFFGTSPTFTANISRAELLRPHPQFGDISIVEPIGYWCYHSLQTGSRSASRTATPSSLLLHGQS